MPLKKLIHKTRKLHIISMFSWVVHDTGGSARVRYVHGLRKAYTREISLHVMCPLKSLHKRKVLTHYCKLLNILCGGSMQYY